MTWKLPPPPPISLFYSVAVRKIFQTSEIEKCQGFLVKDNIILVFFFPVPSSLKEGSHVIKADFLDSFIEKEQFSKLNLKYRAWNLFREEKKKSNLLKWFIMYLINIYFSKQ